MKNWKIETLLYFLLKIIIVVGCLVIGNWIAAIGFSLAALEHLRRKMFYVKKSVIKDAIKK